MTYAESGVERRSLVGDCRRNLVGRCAESSLVCPKKGKRGNDFYLLCLTTESFTYFVGASQHASSG